MPSQSHHTRPEDARADQREIELKLSLPAELLERVRSHPRVAERAVGPATTQTLLSVYFDTPNLSLADRGIALRVRRAGDGFVQTLKTRGTGRAGLFDRLELEAAIASPDLELGAISDPALRQTLETLRDREGLGPVVETEFERTSQRLAWQDHEVLFEVDEGEVRTERGRAPIAELELELVRGAPTALFELALELVSSAPLRPSTEGKVDRGFALLRGAAPQAQRAVKLEHPADATLGDVIGAITASAAEQIQANEAIARAGVDPEGVHQMRVGLRRLRAAFSTFRRVLPRASLGVLPAEARWLAGELGFVRDLDVFLGETLEPLCARFSEDAGLKRLRENTQSLRDASHDALRQTLDSERYGRFLLELGRWHAARGWLDQPLSPDGARLFQPARSESRALLERLHRRAAKKGRRLAGSTLEEKHALRIELKKLRYGAEFLSSLYDRKAAKRYARRLAQLQDVLGQLNDVATAKRVLELMGEWMGNEAPREVHHATGLVEGWIVRGAEEALVDLDTLWRRFEATPRFWV